MIDRAVEPLVREAFNAVVVGNEKRFKKALKAISYGRPDYAFKLALAIDRTVMRDVHDGTPSDERVQLLAEQFATMQEWSNPTSLPVADFLRSLVNLPAKPIAADVRGSMVFLVGGWLLVAFLNSGIHWYQYLDDILDRLDIEPEEYWLL